MINSNLISIMGRSACYTGQKINWEQLLASKTVLGPEKHAFGAFTPPTVAIPGQTKFG